MTDSTEPTPLQRALIDACLFAGTHDMPAAPQPRDFAIQPSAAGQTVATYVGENHVITVTVDSDGTTKFGVAELFWTHDDSDPEREPCDYCETEHSLPVTTVYLPGDAPAEATLIAGGTR